MDTLPYEVLEHIVGYLDDTSQLRQVAPVFRYMVRSLKFNGMHDNRFFRFMQFYMNLSTCLHSLEISNVDDVFLWLPPVPLPQVSIFKDCGPIHRHNSIPYSPNVRHFEYIFTSRYKLDLNQTILKKKLPNAQNLYITPYGVLSVKKYSNILSLSPQTKK